MAGRRAFSLIELLVVIAIIAILAALLFPVFNRAREQARMTACMTNMHDIFLAISQYKLDYGSYPNLLLGYAENPDGTPWNPGDSAKPVPANQIIHSFLFSRKYNLNDPEKFRCPDNSNHDPTATTTALYPPSSAVQPNPVTFASLGIAVPAAFANRTVYLYKLDSYDISPALDLNGRTDGSYQFVYSRDWTGGSGTQDAPNQLKYPSPPPDRTIVTWCNNHVAIAGGDRVPVLLLSGNAKPIDYKQVVQKGWNLPP